MADWSPDTRRALRAYLAAVALADPLQRELARTYSVALGDLHALRLLRDLGEVPINRLSAALSIKPSNSTKLVDRLEGAGLVERVANPADRRVTALRLTERANDALSDRSLVECSGLAARVERLAPGERLQLAALLERLLERGSQAVEATLEPTDAARARCGPPGEIRGSPGALQLEPKG